MHAPTTEQLAAYESRDGFGLIAVGVDGSNAALEAVRQAAALAGPNSTIELIAVHDDWSIGPKTGPLLTAVTADRALAAAEAELAHTPARVITRAVAGHPAWKALLAESRRADLLVVGRHGHSRVGGIVTGSTATHLLHRAEVPLLLATRPPHGSFPDRIVVAAGGTDHPQDAVEMAALIADRRPADVTLLRVDWSRAAKPAAVREAVEHLASACGKEPEDLIVGGTPHREIAEYAEREGAALVILGSRRLTGLRSFRSVSERVAHECACSVLVVRRHLHKRPKMNGGGPA